MRLHFALFAGTNLRGASTGWSAPVPGAQKNPERQLIVPGLQFKCLAMTYSRMPNGTLPSALSSFTSEFGMGSGGSRLLLSPGKPVGYKGVRFIFFVSTITYAIAKKK